MPKYVKIENLPNLMSEPKVGHYSEYVTDLEYEKGLEIEFGINEQTCGSKRIAMGHTIIPPHTTNERHVHLNAEAAMYITRGNPILLLGPEGRIIKLCPGMFVYAPEGTIHGVGNPHPTEEAELIFAYGGVPSKEAAKIVFIDDSENDDYPPKGWDKD